MRQFEVHCKVKKLLTKHKIGKKSPKVKNLQVCSQGERSCFWGIKGSWIEVIITSLHRLVQQSYQGNMKFLLAFFVFGKFFSVTLTH